MCQISGFVIVLVSLTVIGCSSSFQGCTQEAKLCPDETAVGRTGLLCQFSPCLSECSVDADCVVKKTVACCAPEACMNKNVDRPMQFQDCSAMKCKTPLPIAGCACVNKTCQSRD